VVVSSLAFEMIPFRQLHRTLAWAIALPLLLTASTGMLYRFMRNVLGYEKHQVHWLMDLHQGEFYHSEVLSVLYVVLLAGGALTMLITGYTMVARQRTSFFTLKTPTTAREFHQTAASIVLPLLTISTVTGAIWKICWSVFGIQDKEKVGWLLTIHQGSYIPNLTVPYTLCIFVFVVCLALSGLLLQPYFRNKLNPPRPRERKPRETKIEEQRLISSNDSSFSDKASSEDLRISEHSFTKGELVGGDSDPQGLRKTFDPNNGGGVEYE